MPVRTRPRGRAGLRALIAVCRSCRLLHRPREPLESLPLHRGLAVVDVWWLGPDGAAHRAGDGAVTEAARRAAAGRPADDGRVRLDQALSVCADVRQPTRTHVRILDPHGLRSAPLQAPDAMATDPPRQVSARSNSGQRRSHSRVRPPGSARRHYVGAPIPRTYCSPVRFPPAVQPSKARSREASTGKYGNHRRAPAASSRGAGPREPGHEAVARRYKDAQVTAQQHVSRYSTQRPCRAALPITFALKPNQRVSSTRTCVGSSPTHRQHARVFASDDAE